MDNVHNCDCYIKWGLSVIRFGYKSTLMQMTVGFARRKYFDWYVGVVCQMLGLFVPEGALEEYWKCLALLLSMWDMSC
jgi:hypothetical protein